MELAARGKRGGGVRWYADMADDRGCANEDPLLSGPARPKRRHQTERVSDFRNFARSDSYSREREAGFITPAERAYLEAENRLSNYKHTDEDKDEKELEKEENESEKDEPGKYEPLSIVDKKSSTKSKKGRSSKSTR